MIAYRLLTEDDTSAFCHKVTEAINNGWTLYGPPMMTYDAAWSAAPRPSPRTRTAPTAPR
jgi:hypothetical protein